jgi:hypothetical protein
LSVTNHVSRLFRKLSASPRKKRSLKRIFRILLVAQWSPAQAPNHAAVPPEQQFERTIVALPDETFQQACV